MKHFSFVLLLLFTYLPFTIAQVNEADSLELVRFYHATNGDNWSSQPGGPDDKKGWLVEPVAEWVGIVLNEDGTRVKEIILVYLKTPKIFVLFFCRLKCDYL